MKQAKIKSSYSSETNNLVRFQFSSLAGRLLAVYALCVCMQMTSVRAQPAGSSALPSGNAAEISSAPGLKPIVSTFSTTANLYLRTQIDPNGDILVSERSRSDASELRSTGKLTPQQMAQLARVFSHWERLKAEYPKPSDDPRWQVITYGGKSVAACATSGAPAEFVEASKLLGTIATHQASPEVPSARKEDIEIGITWLAEKHSAPAKGASRGRAMAYVRNISDHAIKVYLPALVGPNFGGAPGDMRPAPIQEARVGGKYGVHNFMVLRPNEMYARGVDEKMAQTSNRTVSAYFIMYREGYEGQLDQQTEVISARGEE